MHDGELLQVHVPLPDRLTASDCAHVTCRLRENITSRRWFRFAWTIGVIPLFTVLVDLSHARQAGQLEAAKELLQLLENHIERECECYC